MQYTYELLIKGDPYLPKYYQNAVERWTQIWARSDAQKLQGLARLLASDQNWFEINCGGRWAGQEIMVVSGFAMLYSTEHGFGVREGQARMLYDAFRSSLCSLEVKGIADCVAESYDLIDSTTH